MSSNLPVAASGPYLTTNDVNNDDSMECRKESSTPAARGSLCHVQCHNNLVNSGQKQGSSIFLLSQRNMAADWPFY